MSFQELASDIADSIEARDASYGILLLPEDLIDKSFEMLLDELEVACIPGYGVEAILSSLTLWSRNLFEELPIGIQNEIIFSPSKKMPIEKLLLDMVSKELKRRALQTDLGDFRIGVKGDSPILSFCGQPFVIDAQLRGARPSFFDTTLAYNLGATVANLCANEHSGYVVSMKGKGKFDGTVDDWEPGGIPFCRFVLAEGVGLVTTPPRIDLIHSQSYKLLCIKRKLWIDGDSYENTGPIQYHCPTLG